MKQNIQCRNYCDEQQNPAGGYVEGAGISIRWQNGPLGRGADREEPNGAFVEGVIQAAIQRLEYYQESKFACVENEKALAALEVALATLELRTARREAAGVEGTHGQDSVEAAPANAECLQPPEVERLREEIADLKLISADWERRAQEYRKERDSVKQVNSEIREDLMWTRDKLIRRSYEKSKLAKDNETLLKDIHDLSGERDHYMHLASVRGNERDLAHKYLRRAEERQADFKQWLKEAPTG